MRASSGIQSAHRELTPHEEASFFRNPNFYILTPPPPHPQNSGFAPDWDWHIGIGRYSLSADIDQYRQNRYIGIGSSTSALGFGLGYQPIYRLWQIDIGISVIGKNPPICQPCSWPTKVIRHVLEWHWPSLGIQLYFTNSTIPSLGRPTILLFTTPKLFFLIRMLGLSGELFLVFLGYYNLYCHQA